jgi:hypothetical protein
MANVRVNADLTSSKTLTAPSALIDKDEPFSPAALAGGGS